MWPCRWLQPHGPGLRLFSLGGRPLCVHMAVAPSRDRADQVPLHCCGFGVCGKVRPPRLRDARQAGQVVSGLYTLPQAFGFAGLQALGETDAGQVHPTLGSRVVPGAPAVSRSGLWARGLVQQAGAAPPGGVSLKGDRGDAGQRRRAERQGRDAGQSGQGQTRRAEWPGAQKLEEAGRTLPWGFQRSPPLLTPRF